MAAITWKTLNSAQPTAALAAFNSAEDSFSNAFSGLRDSFKQREVTEAANWQQGKTNNTNAFMDQLRQFGTPEQMAEAQKSGLLDQLRQGYGAQVDSQAIGAAQDTRMGVLQERASLAGKYQDEQTTRTQQPIIDEIKLRYTMGDKVGADALIAQHPELQNRAATAAFGVDRSRGDTRFSNDQTTFANGQTEFSNKQEMFPGEKLKQKADLDAAASRLLTDVAQRNSLNASANASNANAKQSNAAVDKLNRESAPSKLLEERTKDYLTKSPLGAGTMGTAEGSGKFYKAMYDQVKDNTQQADIRNVYDDEFRNGIVIGKNKAGEEVRIPLPVSLAMEGLQGSTESVWAFNSLGGSRRGNHFAEIIKSRLKDPSYINELGAAYAIQTGRDQPVFDAEAKKNDALAFPKPGMVDPRSNAVNFTNLGGSAPKK